MTTMLGEIFISMKNGSTIKVLEDTGADPISVATIMLNGTLTNRRPMDRSNLHTAYRNKSGDPWETGYVKADALPANHPYAYQASHVDAVPLPSFSGMSTQELLEFANRRLAEASRAKELADRAKAEIRKRQPTKGITVLGDVTLETSYPNRFNADLAKEKLTPEQYAAICVTAPDAERAKQVLGGKDSPLYRSVCKTGDATLKIRAATDEDRRAAEIQKTAQRVVAPKTDGTMIDIFDLTF